MITAVVMSFFDYLKAFKQRHPRWWLLVKHPGKFVERVVYRTALLPFLRQQKAGSTAVAAPVDRPRVASPPRPAPARADLYRLTWSGAADYVVLEVRGTLEIDASGPACRFRGADGSLCLVIPADSAIHVERIIDSVADDDGGGGQLQLGARVKGG